MPRRVNKPAVAAMTLVLMAIVTVAGVLLVRAIPSKDPAPLVAKAEQAISSGNYKLALECYQRAYGRSQDPQYIVLAGDAAREMGDAGSAFGLWQTAVTKDPARLDARRRALALSLELLEMNAWRANSSMAQQMARDAEALLEKEPEDFDGRFARGIAYITMRSGKPELEEKGVADLVEAHEMRPDDLRVLTVLNDYYLRAEQPEKARQVCEALVERKPDSPAGHLMLGRFLLTQGETDGAIEGLQKALELGDGVSEAAVSLAQAHMVKRDYEAAEQLLQKTLAANPNADEAALQLQRLLLMRDRPAEALALIEKRLEAPRVLQGYKAGRDQSMRIQLHLHAASAYLQTAEAADGEPDPQLLARAEEHVKTVDREAGRSLPQAELLWGRIYQARGSLILATKWLEKADKGFADSSGVNPEVRLRLAQVYQQRGELGLTQKMLESVNRLAPQHVDAWVTAAAVAAQLRDMNAAMSKLEAALRLDPSNRRALTLRDALLKSTGMAGGALPAGAGDSQPSTVREQLLEAYRALAQDDEQQAEAIYRKVLKAEPANVQALRGLLALLLRQDRGQDAREVYDQALAQSPDDSQVRSLELLFAAGLSPEQRDQKILEVIEAEPDPFTKDSQLVLYHAAREQYDEATAAADRLEALRPDDDRVISLQFSLAVSGQDWKKAAAYAAMAGKKDLDGAGGGFYRARLAMGQSDWRKAIEELNVALQLYPSFSNGWVLLAEAFIKSNRLQDGRKALEKALELNPQLGAAHKGLAQIDLAEGNEAAFEAHLASAARYLPSDPWVVQQAIALSEKKDPQGAIQRRRQMLDAAPDDVGNMVRLAQLLQGQGDSAEAGKLLDRAVGLQPANLTLAWTAAVFWQGQGDSARAEKVLQGLIDAARPDAKADATILMGKLHEAQGQADAAEQAYKVAIKQAPDEARPYVELGDFYRRAGRLDDAVANYRQSLQVRPLAQAEDVAIRRHLIEMLLQSRMLDEAEKEIAAYGKAFAEDSTRQLLTGTLLTLRGRTDEAITALTDYLRQVPDSSQARYQRGMLYLATNRLQPAIDDLSLAKQLAPAGFDYQHRMALAKAYEVMDQPDRGVTELTAILDADPSADDVARQLAGLYVRLQRGDDLEKLIRQRIAIVSEAASWWQMLGQYGEVSGNYAKAIEGYREAAEASGYDLGPVDDLLRLYIASEQYDRAIDYVRTTLPQDKRVGVAKARLAQALIKKGDDQQGRVLLPEAVAEAASGFVNSLQVARIAAATLGPADTIGLLQQRLTSAPDDLVAKYMLAAMLADQQQWESAEQLSKEIVAAAKDPQSRAMALRQQGSLLYQGGKHAAAATAYEELLKVLPNDGETLNNLAYVLAENLGRPKEALEYARRAVDLRPNDPNVLDTLGWVYYLSGDLDGAVGTLVSALQIAPNNVAVRYHVAMVYKKQGKLDLARKELEQSMQAIGAAGDDPIARMFEKRVETELSNLKGSAEK